MWKANYTRAHPCIYTTAMIRSTDYLHRLSTLIHGHPHSNSMLLLTPACNHRGSVFGNYVYNATDCRLATTENSVKSGGVTSLLHSFHGSLPSDLCTQPNHVLSPMYRVPCPRMHNDCIDVGGLLDPPEVECV